MQLSTERYQPLGFKMLYFGTSCFLVTQSVEFDEIYGPEVIAVATIFWAIRPAVIDVLLKLETC